MWGRGEGWLKRKRILSGKMNKIECGVFCVAVCACVMFSPFNSASKLTFSIRKINAFGSNLGIVILFPELVHCCELHSNGGRFWNFLFITSLPATVTPHSLYPFCLYMVEKKIPLAERYIAKSMYQCTKWVQGFLKQNWGSSQKLSCWSHKVFSGHFFVNFFECLIFV